MILAFQAGYEIRDFDNQTLEYVLARKPVA